MKPNKQFVSQEQFFDQNATKNERVDSTTFFFPYVYKQLMNCLSWLQGSHTILDYGCGTGTSIDAYLISNKETKPEDVRFIGVDISEKSLEKARKQYPQGQFYKIVDHRVSQLQDGSIDAAFVSCVFHHTVEQQKILLEIYRVLKKGGKFFVCDLTESNPIINVGRAVFPILPNFIKDKFLEDLVVEGKIPDKERVVAEQVRVQMSEAGFDIIETGYGHLFFFLFIWLDKFIPLTKLSWERKLLARLEKLEDKLLKHPAFQKKAHFFYIKGIKN